MSWMKNARKKEKKCQVNPREVERDTFITPIDKTKQTFMSGVQRQDLVLFSDQSVLPAQFFQDSSSHNLIFITHQSSTQPLWLINALIETHILGFPNSLNESSPSSLLSPAHTHAVVASFIHEQKHFINSFSKLKIPTNNYNVFDFLSDFIVSDILNKPREKILSELLANFLVALQNNPTNTIVIICLLYTSRCV